MGRLDTSGRPCALPARWAWTDSHAPLPHAHLRRVAVQRRQERAPVGLGASPARPWRALFIDLRDHYGITQVRGGPDSPAFATAETVQGRVGDPHRWRVRGAPARDENPNLPTGPVETFARRQTSCRRDDPPCRCSATMNIPEETRLRYRFLDLRRDSSAGTSSARGAIIDAPAAHARARFLESQMPILTASSPGRGPRFPGAVAPASREVLRLPQAPQQFKQLT